MADKNKSKDKEEKSIKIQETFLKERKVFLWGEVSDKSARDVTEKLLYLEMDAPGKR
jgi:ATP-dependent Clp protease protease subunit